MFSTEQHFTINGEGQGALIKVLEFARSLGGWKQVTCFRCDENGLVFYSYENEDGTRYPFPPSDTVLAEHILSYIKSLSSEDILRLAGIEPNVDGSVRLGWEVFHPLWYGENKISKYDGTEILAVRPSWVVYAK